MRLRPLTDRVIIRPLEYKHSFLYVAGIELRKGVVVAVGPGRRMRRLIPWKLPIDAPHLEGKSVNASQTVMLEDGSETGKVRPLAVQVGDTVEYGFRDVFPIEFDGEKLLVIREQNIYGKTTADQSVGFLEAQSSAIPEGHA